MKNVSFLRAQLLHALVRRPGHGYEAHKRAAAAGVKGGREATYRTLRAMESEGLVASTQADSPLGPRRRNYVVTAAGRAHLAELVAEAERDAELITDFLNDVRRTAA